MSSESGHGNPVLNTVFTIQPFILEHRSYVAITDSRGTWTVIVKYLGGERFEDQCYLRTKPS
jgi:hypothetical protein